MAIDEELMRTRYAAKGGADASLSIDDCKPMLKTMIDRLPPSSKVLIVPPDITRAHSMAGELTVALVEMLGKGIEYDIMPALGTHHPMTEKELEHMFPGIPRQKFLVHDWRNALARIGEVPGEFVAELSGGKVDYPVYMETNRAVVEGGYDVIFSIGQVVPHEVIGMANQNKNIFVGLGGADTINKTHFLGAAYGMERIMGRIDTPVRAVLNECSKTLAGRGIHVVYILTVRGLNENGELVTRGLFIGDDNETYRDAAQLSQRCNLDLLDAPLEKAVVYLQPDEYHSTWLGNKAIYRTRMAMADRGELVVLAPGLEEFGEDPEIDRLIRKYGYRGTPVTLRAVRENEELAANLSAAAHLIHGSSEGRFRITYCPGPGMSEKEIESVGFRYGDLDEMLDKYAPARLRNGFNEVEGETVFFISNPSLGLWALKSDFE